MAMRRGWMQESYRHGLAARGIQTSRRKKYGKDLSGKTVANSTRAGHDFIPYIVRDGLYSGYSPGLQRIGNETPGSVSKAGQETAGKFFVMKGEDELEGLRQGRGRNMTNKQFMFEAKRLGFDTEEIKEFLQHENELKGYYAEKKGLLDLKHEDQMSENIRVRDINMKQERILADLTRAVNEGRMTGDNRERFMREVFANEAKMYMDGVISKEDFDSTVDRKAESFTMLQSRPHAGMFSFGAATGQEK